MYTTEQIVALRPCYTDERVAELVGDGITDCRVGHRGSTGCRNGSRHLRTAGTTTTRIGVSHTMITAEQIHYYGTYPRISKPRVAKLLGNGVTVQQVADAFMLSELDRFWLLVETLPERQYHLMWADVIESVLPIYERNYPTMVGLGWRMLDVRKRIAVGNLTESNARSCKNDFRNLNKSSFEQVFVCDAIGGESACGCAAAASLILDGCLVRFIAKAVEYHNV